MELNILNTLENIYFKNRTIKLSNTKAKEIIIVLWNKVFSKPLFLVFILPKESPPRLAPSVFVFCINIVNIIKIDTIASIVNSKLMMYTLYQIHFFLQL